MRLPVARYGLIDLLVFGGMVVAAAVAGWLWVWVWLAMVFLILLVLLVLFFRDPARKIPDEEGLIISPADGKVVEIGQAEDCVPLGSKALKIGIFMGLFNVHVNRSPVAGTVASLEYVPGKFRNALSSKASAENESNSMVLDCPEVPGGRVLVRQISGVLARKIVCKCKPGERLERGQRFGMIKLGSRAEVYVPCSEKLRVKVGEGEKVRAGSSVLLRYEGDESQVEDSNGD